MNLEKLEALGMKIRSLRIARGWTQARLAGEIEVDPAYISSIESSKKFPSLKLLLKIAEIFDIEPYELFIDEDEFKKFRYKNRKIFEILRDSSPKNVNIFYKIAKVLRSE